MTLPRLQLSVIGDEIGPSLDEMISFAHEHGLQAPRHAHRRRAQPPRHEDRGGHPDQPDAGEGRDHRAGLRVAAFKWKAPGKSTSTDGKVDFAFDPKQCPVEDWVAHAMQIAVILGAPHMRIFSYLRYGGFQPADLGKLTDHLTKLLGLAGHYDITLQLENEPVCNVGNIAELAAFFAADVEGLQGRDCPTRRRTFEEQDSQPKARATCRPLVDIANAWSTGEGRAMPISPSSPRSPRRSISRTAT